MSPSFPSQIVHLSLSLSVNQGKQKTCLLCVSRAGKFYEPSVTCLVSYVISDRPLAFRAIKALRSQCGQMVNGDREFSKFVKKGGLNSDVDDAGFLVRIAEIRRIFNLVKSRAWRSCSKSATFP